MDRFQLELRDHPNPEQSCTRGLRPLQWFSPRLQLQYFLEVSNGEQGFSTPKPSGHWQLLTIGSSDRQGGRLLLLACAPCPPCEPFRRHPKCHLPGKWHLILELSSPAVHSVSDGIVCEDYSVHEGRWHYYGHNAAGAGFPSGEIWCAKCILYCASPYRRSPVAGYEMVWCLLCRYGPAFRHQVSSIHLHMYSRLNGVGGQVKLRRHLPNALPWWLSHSWPFQLLCLSTQSGQVYWIFF